MSLTSPNHSNHQLLERGPAALDSVFYPKTIALIGATEKFGSVGRTILENLQSGGFKGEIFPVNPKYHRILGRNTYHSIGEIPAPIDLAIIVTPAASVPEIVGECSTAGVPGAVIISAGFKECGEPGRGLEEKIELRRGTMRVIGPNCLGVMIPHANLNATFAASMAKSGNIAFLSQSGALCTAILDWSLSEQVGFSAFISIGSMLDVGWGDLIDYFGNDPHTKSIVCYMESVGHARTFLSAAREVSFSKPIIVIKVGHTKEGAQAAASHTGSLTGSDAVLDAAFRRAGVLRVNTISEIFDMAEVLAKQPRPVGPRLAIVTNAGGPAALATDSLISSGGQLATMTEETKAALDSFLPSAWSHGNPVDILGAADAELYRKSIEVVIKDPHVDGVLAILTPQAMTDPIGTAQNLSALQNSESKPLLTSWMGGSSLDSARALLNAVGIPTYDYPDSAARAFALLWHYSDLRRLLYERPMLPPAPLAIRKDRDNTEKLFQAVHRSGRNLLTEAESKEILKSYGIPTVETHIARSEDEAVLLAKELSYPVVLKLLSATITHKSDVGGVQLDLRNSAAVRRAWKKIEHNLCVKHGAGHFEGVTVQPFYAKQGIELILGSKTDPQFGPVLLFGAGGELVEILKDRAIGFPPLNPTLAYRLMEQTRIFQALCGARGRPPVDLNALADLLVRFSYLIVEQRAWISEMDINPLIVSSEEFLALDARILLRDGHVSKSDIPRLAIRPYPAEYITKRQLQDGSTVVFRPIRPEDEEMLMAFHFTLSDTTVSLRYFSVLSLQTRIQHERLARICFADYDREIAIVAEHQPANGRQAIIAVARINRLHDENTAEFAMLIADEWQGQGLGTRLMKFLLHIARAEKLCRVIGTIHATNDRMLGICRKLGFHLQQDSEAAQYHAEIHLQ